MSNAYSPECVSIVLFGRVAPGDCSPGAPTDPYVHTLEHTVPQDMGSLLDV